MNEFELEEKLSVLRAILGICSIIYTNWVILAIMAHFGITLW